MTIRFDDDALALRVSVADLLDREARSSLGFTNRGGFERLWLGQAIHSHYQNEAVAGDPTYRQEVGLTHELAHRGWTVRIQGRVDGMRRADDGVTVVEEIKSVRRAGQLGRSTLELYQEQAAIYTWMWKELEGETARAELILIEIGTYNTERIKLDVDPEAICTEIRRKLSRLINEHLAARADLAERRAAAERLRFPYETPRRGQTEIVSEVEQALEQREHLFVEAPTGLGKTVAALFPVLRYAQRENKRVFVLTAKNLQQEMAGEVLRLLNQESSFRSLRLRAKARMCANHELVCHEEYCRFARDYFLKLRSSGIVEELLEDYSDLHPDVIFEHAKEAEVCPFEVSLELTNRAHAVVCDYNYAFDPYVSLRRFGVGNDLSDTILVIDEAHNLVDRGRGYYSPELGEEQLSAVQRSLGLSPPGLEADIPALAQQLSSLIRDRVDDVLPFGDEDGTAEVVFPADDLWALRPTFDDAFVEYLEKRRQSGDFEADDPFVQLYFSFVRFLDALALSDSSFTFLARRANGRRSFRILCRDASPFLGQIINRTHTTIALSATLAPAEFYQELLGFDPQRTSAISLPSPFPDENRRIVIDGGITTTWKQREGAYPKIAERVAGFAAEVPGNCMVLFPSYAFLSEVAARLPSLDRDLIIQRRSNDVAERERILDRLRDPSQADALLLAVAGGVFAEGVDYPGRMLEAVAIVGPCLPSLNYEQQLLKDFYEERYERGFEYAYVIPGMTRVIQAAGRLIRSDQDRGVIALLDRRFLSDLYARHLPSAWLPDGGVRALVGRADSAARDFYAHPQLPLVPREADS